jgi:hypothetical protein
MAADDWGPRERDAFTLDALERWRSEFNAATWQAPTLTIAGQAFLLNVLATDELDETARLAVLIAGLLAIVAAVWALWRLLARERLYSVAIASRLRALKLDDTRPREVDDRLRAEDPEAARELVWWSPGGGHWAWIAALVAFGVADVFVYCLA